MKMGFGRTSGIGGAPNTRKRENEKGICKDLGIGGAANTWQRVKKKVWVGLEVMPVPSIPRRRERNKICIGQGVLVVPPIPVTGKVRMVFGRAHHPKRPIHPRRFIH